MMRRAIWPRLWGVCALVALAGCEQSSYSSSPEKPEPVRVADAVASESAGESDEPASPSPAEAADSPTAEAPDASTAEPEPSAAAAAPDRSKQPTKDLTFDDIKFDIEKDGKFERSMLTTEIEDLVGRNVRIRGYILPTFQQSGIRNFVLVRDNMECCFGPGAALYDCIVVDMVDGQSTDFTTRPVAVEGKFGIQELLDFDGVVRAIYHLEGKAVK